MRRFFLPAKGSIFRPMMPEKIPRRASENIAKFQKGYVHLPSSARIGFMPSAPLSEVVSLRLKQAGFSVILHRSGFDPAHPRWCVTAMRDGSEWKARSHDLNEAFVELERLTQSSELTVSHPLKESLTKTFAFTGAPEFAEFSVF